MTTLELFLQADKKVTEVEERNYEAYNPETDRYEVTEEYTKALEYSQKLYRELQEKGINPFN